MMKLTTLLGLFCFLALVSPIAAQNDNCVTCHQEFEEEDGPSHIITRDIHIQKGLGCADCHGGDPALEDMDEVRQSKGYRGVPTHQEIPEYCAHCHSDAAYMRNHNPGLPTDQLDKYKTSIHGQRLFSSGDEKVANCISCHSVHEISNGRLPHSSTHPLNLPATCGKCHSDAELMAEYKIPTDQLHDYEQSVHGQALLERKNLGAPACNDCHGNHGAAPPGISSIAAVCGTCHAFEAELFLASPHKEAYEENEFPMCETCHSNHKILKPLDNFVGTDDPAVCTECHSAEDGTRAFFVADSITSSIQALLASQSKAKAALDEAMAKGMATFDDELLLKEVNQALIQTRTLVHSFGVEQVAPKAAEGIAKADSIVVHSATLVDEYYFRRKGLLWSSLFITILVIGLYMKIRSLD